MKFLNGLKTVLGALGLALTIVVPSAAPDITAGSEAIWSIAQGIFGALTAVGVIHKVEKVNAVHDKENEQ